MLRSATTEDAAAIAGIYNHYILHDIATFEEVPVDVVEMQRRIELTTKGFHWRVGYWQLEL